MLNKVRKIKSIGMLNNGRRLIMVFFADRKSKSNNFLFLSNGNLPGSILCGDFLYEYYDIKVSQNENNLWEEVAIYIQSPKITKQMKIVKLPKRRTALVPSLEIINF